jgi:hypothetical protein
VMTTIETNSNKADVSIAAKHNTNPGLELLPGRPHVLHKFEVPFSGATQRHF